MRTGRSPILWPFWNCFATGASNTIVQGRVRQIVNTPRKLEKLKAIARSRTLGIWRIKWAKIILGTLAGKTVLEVKKEIISVFLSS